MIPRALLGAALATAAFAAGAQSASAATASGHSALALAAIVGGYSPTLSVSAKLTLARLLDGKSVVAKGNINVAADGVVCRAGDVDITAFSCDLTFGAKKISFTGRRANELFATIGEAGVASEGAAGTIYEALHALSCTIDPAGIAKKDGSGATCNFDPGPPP